MTESPLSFDELKFDDTPFPMLVAKRFNFPLAYHESGDEVYYAIQDWIRGLTGKKDVRAILMKLRTHSIWEGVSNRTYHLSYKTSNQRIHQREFTTDQNLILILQHLRPKRKSPFVTETKQLWVRWFTEKLETHKEHNRLLDSDIPFEEDQLTVSSNDAPDILRGILRPAHILDKLQGQVVDPILPKYYDVIAEEIYKGLWGRSPKQLKLELGLVSVARLSEAMPQLGQSFHNLVREYALHVLSKHEQIWWADIHLTVKTGAKLFGRIARETSEILGEDLATGRPFLPS